MTSKETIERLQEKIKILSEQIWRGRCNNADIDNWLSNFTGRHSGDQEQERLHALHLLSSFSYFGSVELRVLLVSMYRDLFRYPIVQEIREDTCSCPYNDEVISDRFAEELKATRFLGMGNPAESGTHLLYHFRQENGIPLKLFAQQNDLFTGGVSDAKTRVVPGIRRVVFIDDLCGSGEQAVRYSRRIIKDVKAVAKRGSLEVECLFLVLFGTKEGLASVREQSAFDDVRAVNELDDTHAVFGRESRVFRNPPIGISREVSRTIAEAYGKELLPRWPLGYGDCQLLLGFHHNVPNNTLPIVWWNDQHSTWKPVFGRSRKR